MQAIQSLGIDFKHITATEMAGPCPGCGGVDRFRFNTKKLTFLCRGCGAKGGDTIALIQLARGLPFREAVEEINGESGDAVYRPAPAPIPAKADAKAATLEAFIRRMVEKTLRGLVPIIGAPGEAYLRDVRKIDTGAIADVLGSTAALGWHPECFFREDGHRLDQRSLGCIVAVMTDPLTANPTGGISRTYIHEGQKVGKAKGLGPAGVVRLTPDEEVLGGLHIGEGLETCLAAMSLGLRPMWSTGSTAIMAKLPVVGGIECISVLADHDENGAGERAALELEQRWREAGREVLVVAPSAPGDFNDVIMRGAL